MGVRSEWFERRRRDGGEAWIVGTKLAQIASLDREKMADADMRRGAGFLIG